MCSKRVPTSLAAMITLSVIAYPPPIDASISAHVPIAKRVEEASLIVVGEIVSIEQNKHLRRWYEAGGSHENEDRPYRQRFYHEAKLVITEVLKRSGHAILRSDPEGGPSERWVKLLFVGVGEDSDKPGMTWRTSGDQKFKPGDRGIWFLTAGERYGEMYGTYVHDNMFPLRDSEVEFVKRCLHVIETGYHDEKAGLPIDDRTWIVGMGSESNARVTGCVVDENDDIIVSCAFHSELYLGGKKIAISPLGVSSVMIKLAPTGEVKWSRELGDQKLDVEVRAVERSGDFAVAGELHGEGRLAGVELRGIDTHSLVVATFGGEGELQWVQQFGGSHRGGSMDCQYASNGSLLVAGSFVEDVGCVDKFAHSSGDADVFLAELDQSGKPVRLVALGGEEAEYLHRIAVGADGRLVLSTSYREITDPARPTKRASTDALVICLSPAMDVLWADTLGAQWDDHPLDISFSSDGEVVASIGVRADPGLPEYFLCKWDRDGKLAWQVRGGGDDIEMGPNDEIYCVGSYGLDKARAELPPSAGDRDLFVECYSSDGKRLWARRDGGLSSEQGSQIRLTKDRRAIIVGGYEGTAFLLGKVLKPLGWRDCFIANVPVE